MVDVTAPRATGNAGSVACKECGDALELVAQPDGSVAQERCDACYPTEGRAVAEVTEPEFPVRAKGTDSEEEEE